MKRQKSLPAATALALSLCAISTVWAQSTPTPTPVPPPTVPTPAPQEIPAPTPAPAPPPITPVTPAPIGSTNRPPPARATPPPRPGDRTPPPDQQSNDPNTQTGAVNPTGVGAAGAFAGCNAFDCADINDNEELTEEEFGIFRNDSVPFDDIDRDRNDRISPAEWTDYRRKQANGS